jgi:hypothetical protein
LSETLAEPHRQILLHNPLRLLLHNPLRLLLHNPLRLLLLLRNPLRLRLLLRLPRSQSQPSLKQETIASSRRLFVDSSMKTASTPTPLLERVPEVALLAMTYSITSMPRAPEPVPQPRPPQQRLRPLLLRLRHLLGHLLPPHQQLQLANVTARSVCPKSVSSPVLTW